MHQEIKKHLFVFLTAMFMIPFLGFAQKTSTNVKVMTYNIWNGFDWGKDTARKENWIQWISDKSPDVLALQELCGYTEEKLRTDAARWGHTYVKILKVEGYPVGLTSNKPIILKEKGLDEMWHGFLHCETYGIDFFVVHLSPSDSNFRLKEAHLIVEKIRSSKSDKYIILGDFNAHSPFDEGILKNNKSLLQKYTNEKNKKGYSNLRLGAFDYSVVSTFLGLPAIDVTKNFVDIKARFTFPTPALIGIYQTADEVELNKERIDYILTSPIISKSCKNVSIFNSGMTENLSDHYPIMAEFQF